MTRQYVPHAVTGEPVPVLTPEERAQQRAERDRNPTVLASGFLCHCGARYDFRKPLQLSSGDGVDVTCPTGHRSLLRFLPETFS